MSVVKVSTSEKYPSDNCPSEKCPSEKGPLQGPVSLRGPFDFFRTKLKISYEIYNPVLPIRSDFRTLVRFRTILGNLPLFGPILVRFGAKNRILVRFQSDLSTFVFRRSDFLKFGQKKFEIGPFLAYVCRVYVRKESEVFALSFGFHNIYLFRFEGFEFDLTSLTEIFLF